MKLQDDYERRIEKIVGGTNDGTRVYPKVFGLTAWSENCKWYSSLPLRAGVSLFCEPV